MIESRIQIAPMIAQDKKAQRHKNAVTTFQKFQLPLSTSTLQIMMALFIPSKRILPLTLLFLLLAVSYHQAFADTGAAADGSTLCEEEGTCQWEDSTIGGGQQEALKDPNLVPLTVEFDDYRTTQDVYVMPDIATFYNATPGSKRKLETSFKGQFAKFINMSPDRVKIFWKGQKENVYIADISHLELQVQRPILVIDS